MEDYRISAYIDNELDLDGKIDFVNAVYDNKALKDEAVDLLYQEKLLRTSAVERIPALTPVARKRPLLRGLLDHWGFYGWGVAAAMLVFILVQVANVTPMPPAGSPYRFVVYEPGTQSVSLMGSFSDWKTMNMRPSGSAGYWEITVDLPPGEHRYSFLVDNSRQIADPTNQTFERDDFGGVNSIISIRSDATTQNQSV